MSRTYIMRVLRAYAPYRSRLRPKKIGGVILGVAKDPAAGGQKDPAPTLKGSIYQRIISHKSRYYWRGDREP